MVSVSMQVSFAGLTLHNPLNTASGTFGFGQQFEDFYDVGATLGAITCKGCAASPWLGNPAPRLAKLPSALMNSVGLQNPGVEAMVAQYGSYLTGLTERGCAVIVQAIGHSTQDYIASVEAYEELAPFASAIEINVSCPNVDAGGAAIGAHPKLVAELIAKLRPRTSRPLFVKMAPENVSEVARAAEAAGADALSLINTISGMSIDVKRRKSRVSRLTAGVSGPAIHALATRMVYDAAHACALPICGMGGIRDGESAAEMILAGATLVSLGTVNLYDPAAAPRILAELTAWAEGQGVASITELIGALDE